MFWDKKEKEVDEFILEDGEREVLYTIGKYNIYDVNKETKVIIEKIIENKTQEILNDDIMRSLFINLTDIPEKELTVERYIRMQKNPKKLFIQINEKINIIVEEEIIRVLNTLDLMNKMPKRAQEIYLEKINEANSKIEKMK